MLHLTTCKLNSFFNILCLSLTRLLIYLSCTLFLPTLLFAADNQPKNIFIIASYERGGISQLQEDGFLEELARNGFIERQNLAVQRFYMNTKRIHTTPEAMAVQGGKALQLIRQANPDLVLILDDNATIEVMLPLVESDIQIVFSGLNHLPEFYNQKTRFMNNRRQPGYNVTGIHEKLQIIQSLTLIKEIIPGLDKIVALVDQTPTGDAVLSQLKKMVRGKNLPVNFSIERIGTWQKLEKTITRINNDPEIKAYFPILTALTDKTGNARTIPEIIPWLVEHCHKPDLSVNYLFSRLGFFGGAAVDFKAMGAQAGAQAAKILNGTTAGELPIEDAARFAIVFNLKRARQLKITIPAEILGAADTIYNSLPLPTPEKPLRIMIVQSYEEGKGCGSALEKGMLAGLAQAGYEDGKNLAITHHFMNTRMAYLSEEEIDRQGQAALQAISTTDPDMIVVFDDNAVEQVMLPLAKSKHPIFFGGMNIAPEIYNQKHQFMQSRAHPGFNITGITEENDHSKSFRLIKELLPKARTLAVVSSCSTLFLRRMNQELQQWLQTHPQQFPFKLTHFEEVNTLAEYQETMLRLESDPQVDIIYPYVPISLIRADGSGAPLTEALSWTFKNIKKPDFTWMTSFVEMGYLGAIGIDLDTCGRQLAGKIEKAIKGFPVAEIPISQPEKYAISLNLARARQLNLTIPLELLEGAQVVFEQMSVYPGFRAIPAKPEKEKAGHE
ncbi:MAG: ABC transporter substrate binding protein [Pseudomonadota bacterium]|nr:ABC transporter substrate binding protein [Pseudomonadota bacterium]